MIIILVSALSSEEFSCLAALPPHALRPHIRKPSDDIPLFSTQSKTNGFLLNTLYVRDLPSMAIEQRNPCGPHGFVDSSTAYSLFPVTPHALIRFITFHGQHPHAASRKCRDQQASGTRISWSAKCANENQRIIRRTGNPARGVPDTCRTAGSATEPSSNTARMALASSGVMDRTVRPSQRFSSGIGTVSVSTTSRAPPPQTFDGRTGQRHAWRRRSPTWHRRP